MKCTMLQLYKDPKAENSPFPLSFNEWKYFSIKIPCDIENSSGASDVQQLDLELIVFEQDARVPKLIGKNYIKLVDILNKTAVPQQVELRHKRQVICKLELDLVMVYGSLGYGYSHQLIHPKKNLEGVVERSIFLRCLPPDHRKDSHFNVITPIPVPYTDFVGALLKRDATGFTKTSISLPGVPPIVMEMLEKRGRILQLHEAMEACQSSEEEVKFLEKLVMRKGPRSETTWRMNKTGKGLSKWKTASPMISNVMSFAHSAKKDMPDDQIPMTAPTLMKSVPVSQASC
ncbi:cation channel sperm-associated targeting subunit tau-like isoform X2 [Osmerus eperlanus]